MIFINSDWGQNLIISKITSRLSSRLKSEISIKRAGISLLNKIYLDGVLIRDLDKDTLLYAGRVRVRITDWFIFKNKVDLQYIGLEEAQINLSRTDSVWNYQYLVDYLSGGGSSGSEKEGVTVDLKKIILNNTRIVKRDRWKGEDMSVWLGTMSVDADEINLKTRQVEINSISFTKPVFEIRKYARLKPPSPASRSQNEITEDSANDSSLLWNAAGWKVHADQINIYDGIFRNIKESQTPYFTYFDGRNIEFASIFGDFTDVSFIGDTVSVQLSLKTREQSGFEVKSMHSLVKFMPTAMEFNDMEIMTNNSIIRDYFRMSYSSMDDLGDFISKVTMDADFKEAEIDSDDIAFFAPSLSAWKKNIKVTGSVRGTVDNISGKGLNIEAGRNSMLNGDISMIGLPDIHRTFIDFRANDFRTNYSDAATFFPVIRRFRTPDLASITVMRFNGSFTGFLRDFVTYGNISTNLGVVVSDLNMKLPLNREPFYSGNLASKNFELGKFLRSDQIGEISFSSKIYGTGVRWATLRADFNTTIEEFVLNNYHYENIRADGSLDKKIFNGNFSIADSNAKAELKGVADFRGDIPRFNLVADVQRFSMKDLQITRDNYVLSGKFDLDFAGDNIDNFLGNASVSQAVIAKNGISQPVEYLKISSAFQDNRKILTLDSKELTARISGNYQIRELPNAFKYFLSTYYPSLVDRPVGIIDDQVFSFEINSNYLDEYANLVDSNLHGLNNVSLNGSVNTNTKQLKLEGRVPSVIYKNYEFENVELRANGEGKVLAFTGVIDQLKVSDSLSFPYTKVDISSQNDSSRIAIVTESSISNIPGATLNARVRTFRDGFDLKFDTTQFVLNGKNWTIQENGELEFRSGEVSYGEVILKESNQEIVLKTQPSGIGDWNDMIIELQKVNIGDFTSLIKQSNRFEGLASGNIIIEDPLNRFNVSADLSAEQLMVDNDSIGGVRAYVFYNKKTGDLTAKGSTLNREKSLDIDLFMNLSAAELAQEDEINLSFNDYPISMVERFIGDLFIDLNGTATGKLKIAGKGANRKYTGNARLHNAGLKVVFTNCYYKIADTEIRFLDDALDLGRLTLIDTLTNNTATIRKGLIRHHAWNDMDFDIEAVVDNQPIQLLNTGAKDNSSFYGYARGTGSFSLKGPQSNMVMRINGIASNRDSSYITIPNTTSRASGSAEFLIERKYGVELSDTVKKQSVTNITYNVELAANPMVNVRVVLDELTNDEIRGRGSGNLRITSGTDEPIRIHGRYRIDEGSYLFSFQSFFKKPFFLKRGEENYIEWTGDPYEPTVKIDAVYETSERVDFSPLLNANTTGTGATTSLRDYVYVIAQLRGNLFNPDIKFALDFPEESPAKRNVSLAIFINQLQKNEDELTKQVAFLVVFNSFVPIEAGASLRSSGTQILVNNISGIISSKINAALNNFLSQKLKIPGLNINFSGSLYNPRPFSDQGVSNTGIDRTNINLAVAKTILNNRVVLVFEGNADVPINSTSQVQGDLLKNFSTEFLINKSGTVRATLFYKENVDYLTGTSTVSGSNKSKKFGASLAYRREFTRLADLFRNRNKKQKAEAVKEEE